MDGPGQSLRQSDVKEDGVLQRGNVSFFLLKYYLSYFSITQMEKVRDLYATLDFCRISISGKAPIHTSKSKIRIAGDVNEIHKII